MYTGNDDQLIEPNIPALLKGFLIDSLYSGETVQGSCQQSLCGVMGRSDCLTKAEKNVVFLRKSFYVLGYLGFNARGRTQSYDL